MKNRPLFPLLLAVVLAMPVFAQDNSTPPTQATTQTTTTQPATPATSRDTATGKEPLQPETREGFWGRVNPFARKKYVARQTQPFRERIKELDTLTSPTST